MNTKMIRALALGLVCASLVGASTVASARGWDDWRQREIHRAERRIDELRRAKDRAVDHHNWREVHRIEVAIDRERDIIRRDREHDRDRERDHSRDHRD